MVDVTKIEKLLKKSFEIIGTYTINNLTGVVDVNGNVFMKIKASEMPVQFGRVSGYFSCPNRGLTTLNGAPTYVKGGFGCAGNKLTNLTHAPSYVGGEFYCDNNQLSNLNGAPTKVGGNFICKSNQLTTLQGAPFEVAGDFNCINNPLMSLQGVPDHIGKWISLDYNPEVPLLRLCMYKGFTLLLGPTEVIEILRAHAHQGRSGALKASLKLIRAGYRENARW